MGKFIRGYDGDAGTDIVIDKEITFPEFETTIVDLGVFFNPPPGTLAYLIQRTSAAKLRLTLSSSPIDPGYEGPLHAIVMNNSPYPVTYKAGESFCQLVVYPLENAPKAKIKKPGEKRGSGAFGSSDK